MFSIDGSLLSSGKPFAETILAASDGFTDGDLPKVLDRTNRGSVFAVAPNELDARLLAFVCCLAGTLSRGFVKGRSCESLLRLAVASPSDSPRRVDAAAIFSVTLQVASLSTTEAGNDFAATVPSASLNRVLIRSCGMNVAIQMSGSGSEPVGLRACPKRGSDPLKASLCRWVFGHAGEDLPPFRIGSQLDHRLYQ